MGARFSPAKGIFRMDFRRFGIFKVFIYCFRDISETQSRQTAVFFAQKRVSAISIYGLQRDRRAFWPNSKRAYQHGAPNQGANETQPPHTQNDHRKRDTKRNTTITNGG